LAKLLWAQGDLTEAQALLQRALAIRDRVLGPNHVTTVASRRALSEISSELTEIRTEASDDGAEQIHATERPARTDPKAERSHCGSMTDPASPTADRSNCQLSSRCRPERRMILFYVGCASLEIPFCYESPAIDPLPNFKRPWIRSCRASSSC